MTISAIIPTLGNRPEMLKQAIDSIKNQTVPVLEILVMDFPDTAYGNQSRRLNQGIQKSKGDAYFFMGDDDILEPNFIERMIAEFEVGDVKGFNWDIVTSKFKNFGDEDGVHCPGPFPLCSTVTRRRIYDKTKGFDEEIPIGIDADFYFQCFEARANWTIIPDVLYKSRVHKDQYSRTGDWTNYHPLLKKKYNGKYSHI